MRHKELNQTNQTNHAFTLASSKGDVKTEGKAQDFQHLSRDLTIVNTLKNNV